MLLFQIHPNRELISPTFKNCYYFYSSSVVHIEKGKEPIRLWSLRLQTPGLDSV